MINFNYDLFKVSKMINFNYDLLKVGKMTRTGIRKRQILQNNQNKLRVAQSESIQDVNCALKDEHSQHKPFTGIPIFIYSVREKGIQAIGRFFFCFHLLSARLTSWMAPLYTTAKCDNYYKVTRNTAVQNFAQTDKFY